VRSICGAARRQMRHRDDLPVLLGYEDDPPRLVQSSAVHRFENFSDDLAVWVMFYGAEGGEATSRASGVPASVFAREISPAQ